MLTQQSRHLRLPVPLLSQLPLARRPWHWSPSCRRCLLTRRSLRGVPLHAGLWQCRSLRVAAGSCSPTVFSRSLSSRVSGLQGPPPPSSVSILGLSLGQNGLFPTPYLDCFVKRTSFSQGDTSIAQLHHLPLPHPVTFRLNRRNLEVEFSIYPLDLLKTSLVLSVEQFFPLVLKWK